MSYKPSHYPGSKRPNPVLAYEFIVVDEDAAPGYDDTIPRLMNEVRNGIFSPSVLSVDDEFAISDFDRVVSHRQPLQM